MLKALIPFHQWLLPSSITALVLIEIKLHYVVGSDRLVMRTINLSTVGDQGRFRLPFLAAVSRIVIMTRKAAW